jgi:O6-methylguanine-DNA--protein-cysteine methyltransferase
MATAGSAIAWRTTTETPLGPFTVVLGECGVLRTRFEDDDARDGIEDGEPDAVEDPRRTASIRREVDAYFRGRLHVFETPVDLSSVGDGFARRALEVVHTIPYGELWTYGDVAGGAARSSCSSRATASSVRVRRSAATGVTTTAVGSSFASRVHSPVLRRTHEKVAMR